LYRTRDWDWTAARTEFRLALNADPADPVSLMLDGLLSMTLDISSPSRNLAAIQMDPAIPCEDAACAGQVESCARRATANGARRL
jgi:hypothetical protein